MRLQTLVGDRGFVGRIGGDELCVAIRDSDLFMSDALAEEFRHAVASTCVMVGQQQVSRSASIGVTVLTPEQRLVDALLLGEDAAAQAKSDGRNRVQIANDTILASRAQRRAKPTVEDLRAGLARGEVVYYVQPIWNIRTGQPVGVEALIRWITPNGQVRMPSEFLDTMTANYHLKLKPPLAAANYAARTFTHNRPDLFCTFNISNTFMERYHSLKPQWITDLLQGLQPGQLVFEIVESAVINDPEGAKRVFAALRKSGARVALDDFGKGLSNLERLREYPVDIVKIDQQFIQSLDGTDRNTAIVRGLVEMSRTLGFAIIAEGVETEAQLEQVKSLGIDMVQGFLLGRPATVEHWARQLL
jgi:EAL domain-containing protein (putative c-di-GMP-specific phosphodiesterase class I)